MAARLRYARFPYRRTIDEFDYEFQPTVDRILIDDLATLRFVDENRPILFLGQPGCGQTHLAVALATLAVEAGYRGYIITADNLCRTPVRASLEGTLASKLKTFTAPTVLVIDDVGLLPIGGTEAAAVFFQVVNTRYEKGHPTIVTTNRSLPDWGTIFGDTSSQPPCWTGSCTTPSCSTSKAPPGGYQNTTGSKSPPPTPTNRAAANLTTTVRRTDPRVGFR